MGIDIVGEFHNALCCDYQQHAYNEAYSDDTFGYGCWLDHGALPYRPDA
jgi:hypothetical protein